MAKSRTIESSSSDDDVPEAISKSTSQASARRHQKNLRNFEAEEKARRKTRNRERDMKLKERALATRKNKRPQPTELAKGGSSNKNIPGEEEDDDLEMDMSRATDGGNVNRMKARMNRATQEALEEDDEEEEFGGFGSELGDATMLIDSGSEEAEDTIISHEGNSGSGAGSPENISEGSMSEGEGTLTPSNLHRSRRRPLYLSDDLFVAAFASQKSTLSAQKANLNHREPTRKRQRKPSGRPKDVVVGYAFNYLYFSGCRVTHPSHRGRTIRTLTRLSDPQSKATARTLPSAHARAFVNRSLAVEGKGSLSKQRGWERRPGKLYIIGHRHLFCSDLILQLTSV